MPAIQDKHECQSLHSEKKNERKEKGKSLILALLQAARHQQAMCLLFTRTLNSAQDYFSHTLKTSQTIHSMHPEHESLLCFTVVRNLLQGALRPPHLDLRQKLLGIWVILEMIPHRLHLEREGFQRRTGRTGDDRPQKQTHT